MSIALVGHVSRTNDGTSSSIDTTGANFLVAVYSCTADGSTVSDSKGNTWTRLTSATGDFSGSGRIAYAVNPTVGTGHTFTISANDSEGAACFAAFSGVDTSSPFDQQNSANVVGGSGNAQPGSVTPSVNNELLIAGALCAPNVTTGIDSSFTITDVIGVVGGANWGNALAYKIQTTAGAENPTFSNYLFRGGAAIATFKAASGGASPVEADPIAASLVLTGLTPTILTPRLVVPAKSSLTLTGLTPAIVIGIISSPPKAALVLTGLTPTVLTPRVVSPSHGALVLVGLTPTVSISGAQVTQYVRQWVPLSHRATNMRSQ